MGKGFIKITPELITHALHFPDDWEIISCTKMANERDIQVLISGKEFPEEVNEDLKEFNVIIHYQTEAWTFEVKELV